MAHALRWPWCLLLPHARDGNGHTGGQLAEAASLRWAGPCVKAQNFENTPTSASGVTDFEIERLDSTTWVTVHIVSLRVVLVTAV